MKRSNILYILPLVALVVIQQSCKGKSEEKAETKTQETTVKKAETFVLSKGQLSSKINIPGQLVAYQQVDLYAKVNSFVKRLYADVGAEVRQGQLLAVLEAPELGSQLSGAQSRLKAQEANYIASKANYDRLLETSKTPGTISPNDLDQALARQRADKAQLDAVKAAINEVRDNQNYLQIRAPFSGIITGRNVSTGAYVGPSGKGSDLPVFSLQEQKKLRLVVNVNEANSNYLNNQSEMDFRTSSFPGKTFKAKVSRLAGALDERLFTQRIEMDVDNSDKKLLPGTVVEVLIDMKGTENAFIVPKTAMLNATTGIYVIVIKDQKTAWVPVTMGKNDGENIEVFGELNEGDTVIKTATEEVRDGGRY